jgi:hypothetical protein
MIAPWLLFAGLTLGFIAGAGPEGIVALAGWIIGASQAAEDVIPALVCTLRAEGAL